MKGKKTQDKPYLVDAVAQAVGDAADDGAANFGRSHLAQLLRRRIRIESRVRCTQDVRRLF